MNIKRKLIEIFEEVKLSEGIENAQTQKHIDRIWTLFEEAIIEYVKESIPFKKILVIKDTLNKSKFNTKLRRTYKLGKMIEPISEQISKIINNSTSEEIRLDSNIVTEVLNP